MKQRFACFLAKINRTSSRTFLCTRGKYNDSLGFALRRFCECAFSYSKTHTLTFASCYRNKDSAECPSESSHLCSIFDVGRVVWLRAVWVCEYNIFMWLDKGKVSICCTRTTQGCTKGREAVVNGQQPFVRAEDFPRTEL